MSRPQTKPISPLAEPALNHPLILLDCKNNYRNTFLLDHFSEAFDEGLKAGVRHIGDEFVEHATLTKQGMGAPLGGIDLTCPPVAGLATSRKGATGPPQG